jgi:hypothetical protein
LEKTTTEETVEENKKEEFVDYEEHIQTTEVNEPVTSEEIPLA